MGGCASRPKDYDIPGEAPASPEKAQPETTVQEKTVGGENQNNEKPLVDLSEPEKEAQDSSSESKAAVAAEPVSAGTVAETAKPTEDNVKADAKKAEEKVEATEEKKTAVPAKEAEADKSNAAPGKQEEKSDAPLVTL